MQNKISFYFSLSALIFLVSCQTAGVLRDPAATNRLSISITENLKLARPSDSQLTNKEFLEALKQLRGGPRIAYRTEYFQAKVRRPETVVDQTSPHCELLFVRPIAISDLTGPYVELAQEITIDAGSYEAEYISGPFPEIKFDGLKGAIFQIRCASGHLPEHVVRPTREVLSSAFGSIIQVK
jgi:hypothetical protein